MDSLLPLSKLKSTSLPPSNSFSPSPPLHNPHSPIQITPNAPHSHSSVSRLSDDSREDHNGGVCISPDDHDDDGHRNGVLDSPSDSGWPWAKPIRLLISVAVGIILRFIIPRPAGITLQAWQLLAIFLSTIAGLILGPLPMGAWAFVGLTVSVVSRTLTFSAAFSAFTSEVLWLIVISFFFARGFVKTGLGDRIATYFIKWLGRSTLGLSYGLILSEVLIAPAMPSTTARAGGVFVPIIKSLSLSAGSRPRDPSAKKLGSYLVMSQFQVSG